MESECLCYITDKLYFNENQISRISFTNEIRNYKNPLFKGILEGIVIMQETLQKENIKERVVTQDELLPPYVDTKCMQVMKYITKNLLDPDIYDVLKTLYFADKIHLLEYNQLMIPDKYIKMEFGPAHRECYNILKFLEDINFKEKYNESIKKELLIDSNKKIYCLTDPDVRYLSISNFKCLNKAIKEFRDSNSEEIEKKCHDEIYDSVNFNEEITEIHIANVLDPSGKLTDYLENY